MKKKLQIKKANWSFITTDISTNELLLSNDGKYIFHCKFQLGNFEGFRIYQIVQIWDIEKSKYERGWYINNDGWRQWVQRYPECSYDRFKN